MTTLALVTCGCTGLKHVSSDDPLFSGSKLDFVDDAPTSDFAISQVRSAQGPIPNNQFLWMRPAVARNAMLSDSAKVKKFWRKKIAEPILVSQTKPLEVSRVMRNRLFHEGYFSNSVVYDTVRIGQKRAKYRYSVTLGEPHRIGNVTYPKPTDDLTSWIKKLGSNSLLRSGDIYSLETIKNERIRINQGLREKGYIYFNPEFLILRADTVTAGREVNVRVLVKPETPPESRKPYFINRVLIHDDHTLNNLSLDTLNYDPYYLISGSKSLRFDAIRKGVFIEPGKRFSRSDQTQTIRYLGNLPIVRYVNVKFSDSDKEDHLDAMLYLNHKKRYSYSAEFNTVFRSTNFFGPGVIFSYTDRNLKGGAERLKVDLRGRFEMQISEGTFNPAYEVGVQVEYTVPGLYPSFLANLGKRQLPRTNVTAGYNLFNRLDLYQLNSVFAGYGFRWSKDETMGQSLNPIEIIYTQVPESSKSDEFKDYLNENPGVSRSFDQQFVIGSGYEFTYNPKSKGRRDFYFYGGIDVSGNMLYLLSSATNVSQDSLDRYTPFGLPFSQYARSRADFRYSHRFSDNNQIATRLVAGLGVPYGNSDILPYVKQFYVGGTNSLRSFLARSVGPGSEIPPEGFADLTGDIRLEWSIEYRFSITRVMKGALFVDAGNVWLYNEDPARPNGNFDLSTFLSELAISSGFGMRWDFDFIVARLDLAYTLRTPYLPQGERWTKGIKIFQPVYNLAVGYPF